MNTPDIRKRLTAIAAICSAVFLFAACEPQNDQPGVERDDPAAPTYGEPDRPADPAHDPAAPQQEQPQDPQADQWEDDTGTGTGPTN